jgi:hypothetical protein
MHSEYLNNNKTTLLLVGAALLAAITRLEEGWKVTIHGDRISAGANGVIDYVSATEESTRTARARVILGNSAGRGGRGFS